MVKRGLYLIIHNHSVGAKRAGKDRLLEAEKLPLASPMVNRFQE